MNRSATRSQNIRWILDPKIAGRVPTDMVSLSKERFNCAFHPRGGGRIRQFNRDEIQRFATRATHSANYPALCGGQRNKYNVVLTASRGPEPLFIQHTNNDERDISDPKCLANSSTPIEQLLYDDGAHDGNFGCRCDLVICKGPAMDNLPFAGH